MVIPSGIATPDLTVVGHSFVPKLGPWPCYHNSWVYKLPSTNNLKLTFISWIIIITPIIITVIVIVLHFPQIYALSVQSHPNAQMNNVPRFYTIVRRYKSKSRTSMQYVFNVGWCKQKSM